MPDKHAKHISDNVQIILKQIPNPKVPPIDHIAQAVNDIMYNLKYYNITVRNLVITGVKKVYQILQ